MKTTIKEHVSQLIHEFDWYKNDYEAYVVFLSELLNYMINNAHIKEMK